MPNCHPLAARGPSPRGCWFTSRLRAAGHGRQGPGLVGLLLAAVCAFTLPGAHAAPPAFAPWLAAWQAEVARGDAAAVAARAQLPFLFEGQAQDAAGFARRVWPALFTPALRRCWAQARPLRDGDRQVLACGPYLLVFGADAAGRWALREFGVDAER